MSEDKDTIYRDDAVKAVCKGCLKENPHCRHHWDCPMLTNLGKLPSADRPQGEWIRDMYWSRGAGMGEEYGFFYKCSLCEYEVENGYTRCSFNFCPHCGARMKGADDEDN